jgi:hypothetical protein
MNWFSDVLDYIKDYRPLIIVFTPQDYQMISQELDYGRTVVHTRDGEYVHGVIIKISEQTRYTHGLRYDIRGEALIDIII